MSGCTTQTTTKVENFEGSTTVSSFNERKAAKKRVEAAQVYLQKRNLQRAKYHLDKAIEHDDDYPDVYLTLGFYYELANNFPEAKKAYAEALSLDRRNPEFKNTFARFLCRTGEYDRAEELFEEAINTTTFTRVDQAYVNAGVCQRAQGNNQKALEYFRRAINLNPKLPDALIEIAKYEFDQERYLRAKQYIERYREVSRHTPNTLWLALRVESKLGNKDGVASYALQLQNLYPDSAETMEYLDSKEQWQ